MPDIQRLLNAIDAAEERSYGGGEGGELDRERSFALDYYYGRNIEPAPEGRSQVVDRSVFETIQWILPSLCRIFANGDDVVEFVPFGEEDEEPAKQESDYLNYLVTQRNPWFEVFLTWAQDCLLMKNAYCMAYIDESIQVETESYKRQSDEAVALLTQDEGVEVVEFASYPDEQSPPQVSVDPATGMQMIAPRMVHDLTIRRTKPRKALRFQVLPPERCKIAESTSSWSLKSCDYFEYYDDKTISSLREDGFDVPDDIASGGDIDQTTDFARDLYDEQNTLRESSNDIDPSMRIVRVRMIWIRHDYDEDGIAELQKVIRVGQTILKYEDGTDAIEQATRIPVASIVPNINPHRHLGTSIADMVIDIQRIKTAILRQGLDSLYQANSPRHAISDKVNLDDMSVTAPGWNVRLEDGAVPGEGHIMPLVTPFVFPQAMEGLEYMDQIRENRTGTNRYFTGIDQNALNKTATGIQQLSTMAAQRVEQIARIISSGVEYLFSVAHELVLKSGHKTETVKLRGQWVEVDPSQWKTGRDMRICVGYGAGNKDALVSRLMLILNAQKEALAGGLPVVTPENVYEALVELTKASDFAAPARFWTDPKQIPPQPPQPSDAELYAQVEQAKIQSSERIKGADIQQQDKEATIRAEIDKYKADLDAEVKVYLEQIRSGQAVNLENLKAKFKGAPDKLQAAEELVKQFEQSQTDKFAELMNRMEQAVSMMQSHIAAPREVVRDKRGRVTGVRVGDMERQVKRDERGRVMGLQ